MSDDPFLSRLLRHPSGLRAGGASPDRGAVATYWTRQGEALFAFRRDGLLLDPERTARFIAFIEIADAGYYNPETTRRAQRMRQGGKPEALSIELVGGEVIDLPLDSRDDGMPDHLFIASLIEQRVRIARSEQRRQGAVPGTGPA